MTDIPLQQMEGDWTGDVRGNAMASVFAESKIVGNTLVFDIRANGPNGMVFYRGVFQPPASIVLTEQTTAGGSALGPVAATIVVKSFQPRQIDGTVELATGAKGAVWLYRVPRAGNLVESQQGSAPMPFPEAIARETQLPSMTLRRRDLDALISRLKALLPGIPITLATQVDGKNITQDADAFLARNDLPPTVSHLRLAAIDARTTVHKQVFVAISKFEQSRLFVQSDDAVWTVGAHENLSGILNRSIGRLKAMYHKYGLNLNLIVFVSALIYMPDLNLLSRFVFIALTLAVLVLMKWVHGVASPAAIDLQDVQRGRLDSVVTDLTATAIGGIAVVGLGFVSKYIQDQGGVSKILEYLLTLAGN